jgi:hypothetical protein
MGRWLLCLSYVLPSSSLLALLIIIISKAVLPHKQACIYRPAEPFMSCGSSTHHACVCVRAPLLSSAAFSFSNTIYIHDRCHFKFSLKRKVSYHTISSMGHQKLSHQSAVDVECYAILDNKKDSFFVNARTTICAIYYCGEKCPH